MQNFSDLIEAYIKNKLEGKGRESSIANWLDSAAKRAPQISLATHVLKFTNSEAAGTNIYSTKSTDRERSCCYVSTRSLKNPRKDFTGNASAMDVTGLLQLKIGASSLLDLILENDPSPFAKFAESEEQLSAWMTGFQSVKKARVLSSHYLAKQVYFPIENRKYHLLSPIYSSSLAQALSDRIKESKFSEKSKEARQCKKKGQHSDSIVIDYPHLAIQKFGGTKPLNVSKLNSERGGKSYLLKSSPPLWRSIEKPPLEEDSFWKTYKYFAKKILRKFHKQKEKINNNKDKRHRLNLCMDELLFLLIEIAVGIQRMPGGWSETSNLPIEQRIWLDANYIEKMNECEDWQEKISKRFARTIERNYEYYSLLHKKCLKYLKGFKR